MINQGMMTSNTPEWATPQDVFDKLNDEFHFDVDVCANESNAKCEEFFSKEQDGLKMDWGGFDVGATLHTVERSESGSKRQASQTFA